MKKYILLFAVAIAVSVSAKANYSNNGVSLKPDTARKKAKTTVFPVPPAHISRLFYVQRDPNPNTVIYELKLKNNGLLDEEEPIHAYWIKYHDKGQHEDLSYIQRKFAYGLSEKKLGEDKYDVRFVCYKKLQLTLMKGSDGKYHIFALIGQKQAILNRIFARIEGGSFWIPNVVYVELNGTDPATGQEVSEKFKP